MRITGQVGCPPGDCGTALEIGNSTAQLPVSPSITPEIAVSAEVAGTVHDGERKTVTALFADIKGSMELMEVETSLAAAGIKFFCAGGFQPYNWRNYMPAGHAICSITLVIIVVANSSFVHAARAANLGGDVVADFKYLTNNALLDVQDIATSPLYVASPDSPLRAPKFYLVLAGAGALWGGSYALDQTMRSHLRSMSSSDADLLQNISYGGVSATAALLYGYGLWYEDPRARHYALNAGVGAGIATLLNIGIKAAFGRLRPSQTSSHTAFFHGGQSFVSGDVTPMFALVAGVSEYFNNEWYVAAPVYSLALLDGFGRMGHDAHWFSDVVGAALLGVGTTELFIWLHNRHDEQPSRWRIFSMNEERPGLASAQAFSSVGVGVAYNW